jgi:hypothetical protein
LAWTEAVTNIRDTHAPDELYNKTRKHFSEKELADLTLAIGAINLLNRLAISMRSVPGRYQPKKAQASTTTNVATGARGHEQDKERVYEGTQF